MNKQDIISNINTKIDDGGLNTAEEVRGVLSVDDNSLLEAVYGDRIVDDSSTQSDTVKNNSCTYDVSFQKCGNTNTAFGTIVFLQNTNAPFIFEISNPDYFGNGRGFASTDNGANSMPCVISNVGGIYPYSLIFSGQVLAGQIYRFSITYNSLT